MRNEEEYKKHIKQSWYFSNNIVENTLKIKGVLATNLKLKIFEKITTPLHFFQQGQNKNKPKPTEAQIKYAKSLDIENPKSYTKKELSEKIKEVLSND